MRIWLLAAVLLLAGCASPGEPTSDDDAEPIEDAPVPLVLPDEIRRTVMMPAGYEWMCLSAACPTYSFELNGNTTVHARLTWTIPTNDHDFMVLDDDGNEAMCGCDVPLQTSEDETAELPAGKYSVILMPYQATPEEVTLVVTFADPDA